MLLGKLMGRVLASHSPRITRIFLCDDEYRQVIKEASDVQGRTPLEDFRVSLAGAVCYRLSEIDDPQ